MHYIVFLLIFVDLWECGLFVVYEKLQKKTIQFLLHFCRVNIVYPKTLQFFVT